MDETDFCLGFMSIFVFLEIRSSINNHSLFMISLIPSIVQVPRPWDITNFDVHGNVSVFRVIIEKCQGNTHVDLLCGR